MANVKITESFIGQVKQAARRSYHNRIQAAKQMFMDENELALLVLNAYIDQAGVRTAWELLPDNWKTMGSQVRWATLNGVKLNHTSLNFDKQVPVPTSMTIYTGLPHIKHPSLDEVVAKFKQWEADHDALVKEQEDFADKIVKFMRRHTSLKQALLEWPEFWDLVPEDYKKTYLKAPEKKAREVGALDIDLAELNGKMVVAKIVEGV